MSAGKTFVRRRGTTPIPNATVHDGRLSYAALGLLTVILARPENAPQGYRALMGRGMGQAATLTALRELDAAGYRHQFRRRGDHQRVITDTVVSEDPISREQAEEWLVGMPVLTMREKATHGGTRPKGASSQVPPRVGSPGHGSPGPGEPPHRTTSSKVTTSLRSESPDRPNPNERHECPHGMPDGLDLTSAGTPRCAWCRRGAPVELDPRQRQAGAHLEEQSA